MPFVRRLGEEANLQEAGGKALNLSILTGAGFNVPPGFVVTTEAYRRYVSENGLQAVIEAAIRGADVEDFSSLDAASEEIRSAFRAGVVAEELRAEILDAYRRLGSPPVAVRSSATAEDLPEASFAGQQDTYLNVEGEGALLRAVVDCWSSLWTGRAISYRIRNSVPQRGVALAVAVQRMVESRASGVMFTVNPLSGDRSETVIDAVTGLGEALVSGRVEPDHVVVDSRSLRVKSLHVGSKGGDAAAPALSDAEVREIAVVGHRIHDLYGSPQDIEWAIAGGVVHVLQSRPVTGLFPPLENVSAEPFRVYGSLNQMQGVLKPFTPIGVDILRYMIGYGSEMFGSRFDPAASFYVTDAGGRVYVDITGLLRNRRQHGVLRYAFSQIEPGTGSAVEAYMEDPRLSHVDEGFKATTILSVAPVFLPFLARVVFTAAFPAWSRRRLIKRIDEQVSRWSRIQETRRGAREHLDYVHAVMRRVPRELFPHILPRVVVGIGSYQQLSLRAEALGLDEDALNVSRGLPFNPTTEMDLRLWEAAERARGDAESSRALAEGSPGELAEAYGGGRLPRVLGEELEGFLAAYGMRGTAEIDVGAPRWEDDPAGILQTMKTYATLTDPEASPAAVFRRGEKSADGALTRIAEEAGRRQGWQQKRLIHFLRVRQRNLAGLREYPKFSIVRFLRLVRRSLLAVGAELAAAGVVERREDVFMLRLAEVEEAVARGGDLKARVAERRAFMERESTRLRIPAVITSENEASYGSAPEGEGLAGRGVSPGVVEGPVHVLLDPVSERLAPGEILVCPGTDPSWTPLFLFAGGLVTEVGGMMTHGSVVAREYGIPAVVGIRDATTRLRTGQRIRVDGMKGTVTLLE